VATFLFGYDVEYLPDPDLSVRATSQVIDLHQRREVPATFFLLGALLEMRREAWRRMFDRPGLDVAQHTWSHRLLVDHQVFGDAANESEASLEISRTRDLIAEVLGRETVGLTTPCGNHGGLRHQEMLLWTLWDEGIRYVRSDMRGPGDTLPAPLKKPYWYEEEGVPLMLETCGHGWQDCALKGYTSDHLAWPPPRGTTIPAAIPTTAEQEFQVHRVSVDYALAHDLVCVFCLHPWSLARIDAEVTTVRLLLDYVLAEGGRVCSFQEFYDQELATRPTELVEAERCRHTQPACAAEIPEPHAAEPSAVPDATPLRENVPVLWEDLLEALDTHWSSGMHYYLDCQTGRLVVVTDFDVDDELREELADDMSKDPDRYLAVEPVGSREAYGHMVEFIATVQSELVCAKLETAIQGKGAFGRFRSVLTRHLEQRDRWREFKEQKMGQLARNWLVSAGVTSYRKVTSDMPSDETDVSA